MLLILMYAVKNPEGDLPFVRGRGTEEPKAGEGDCIPLVFPFYLDLGSIEPRVGGSRPRFRVPFPLLLGLGSCDLNVVDPPFAQIIPRFLLILRLLLVFIALAMVFFLVSSISYSFSSFITLNGFFFLMSSYPFPMFSICLSLS